MEIIKENEFEKRKKDHIRCALSPEAQSLTNEDWDKIFLIPEALPEVNLEEVSLRIESLGELWNTPFFVSSMTAGHSDSLKINSILAEVCAKKRWLLGVGSQRREIEDSQAHLEWKQLRKTYPNVMLASNIGLTQLITMPIVQIQNLVDHTEAKALFIHTNPLQECLQPEGTPQFRGGLDAMERLSQVLSVPIVVKEVGSGISTATIQRLKDIGVAAVDVSGRGGTHWGRVEGLRSPQNSIKSQAAETFKDWGLSTPKALYAWSQVMSQKKVEEDCINNKKDEAFVTNKANREDCISVAKQENNGSENKASFTSLTSSKTLEIWASGGVRNGLQAAKCLALGAQRVGLAKPFLEAAMIGPEAVAELMDLLEYELKISLFCLGIKDLRELKQRKVWEWEQA